MIINILTRCTRPENLSKISKSIFSSYAKAPSIKVHWHIIFDISKIDSISTTILSSLESYKTYYWESIPGDMGHSLLNKLINSFSDDEWIYILDDDNEMHTQLLYEIMFHTKNFPRIEGFIFSQYIGKKDFTGLEIREAKPENVKVQKIDMAQFFLRKSLIGEKRFLPLTYTADGILIEELYRDFPGKFLFIDKVLCSYNSLNENSKSFSLPRVLGLNISKDLKTIKRANYESDELNILNADNLDVLNKIASFNPDCILTTGDTYENYTSLINLPYDFRQRWIHIKNNSDLSGESAYICAMNYILNSDTSTLISIFTSVYNTGEKIKRTYQSIVNQTYHNWEWIVIDDSTDITTTKIIKKIAETDPRVKVYTFKEKTKGIIGEAKYRACCMSNGNFLMELDHDDYLLPHALDKMISAFNEYPDAGFVYSDCAEIDENWNSLTYGEGFSFGYGSYREEIHMGKVFKVASCANINPLTIRHIVGVPNHFRAWKRDVYFQIGGHNRRLSIADDYDLIIRTFLKTKMVHLSECCYLQFYHGKNSQDLTRADIQRRVRTISLFYNNKIKLRFEELGKEDWAYRENLLSWDIEPKKGENENFVNYTYNGKKYTNIQNDGISSI